MTSVNCVKEFWQFFSTQHKDLFDADGNINPVLWRSLSKKLKAIHEDLVFEFTFSDNQNKHLTISADGIEEAFEYVDLVYQYKPEIKDWTFYKFRQPIISLKELSLTFQEIEVKFSDILFHLEIDNSAIIILLFIPGYKRDDDSYEGFKWLILDACLGEYDAAKKVGYCAAYPLEEAGNAPLENVCSLKAQFDSLHKKLHKA